MFNKLYLLLERCFTMRKTIIISLILLLSFSSHIVLDLTDISLVSGFIKNENYEKHLTQMNQTNNIFAGASAVPITPDLSVYHPIYLAGFNRDRIATNIHDDIWSRCCCMQIDNITIALLSVDLIGIMYPEYCYIRQQVTKQIPIDHLIISSTHNHEAPDVIGLWGSSFSSGVNWDWYQTALDSIIESVSIAYYAMEPAGLKIGHALAKNFSRDSREPYIMDEQVETIQVRSLNESVIATMVFYASHPEILWDENTQITSDYPHYLYRYIENETGGKAIFFTGAIGGLITPKVKNHTFYDAQLFGEALASIALSSTQNISILWNTELRVETREILVPLTNPLFRLAAFLGVIQRPYHNYRIAVTSSVSVIELGSNASFAQIVVVPGEDFPENWLELKEKLHASHRILIGLGNDELGYIVPFESFDWQDYEESMSASRYLDPIIHQTLEDMLTINDI